jgi:hypothetical protein
MLLLFLNFSKASWRFLKKFQIGANLQYGKLTPTGTFYSYMPLSYTVILPNGQNDGCLPNIYKTVRMTKHK